MLQNVVVLLNKSSLERTHTCTNLVICSNSLGLTEIVQLAVNSAHTYVFIAQLKYMFQLLYSNKSHNYYSALKLANIRANDAKDLLQYFVSFGDIPVQTRYST